MLLQEVKDKEEDLHELVRLEEVDSLADVGLELAEINDEHWKRRQVFNLANRTMEFRRC